MQKLSPEQKQILALVLLAILGGVAMSFIGLAFENSGRGTSIGYRFRTLFLIDFSVTGKLRNYSGYFWFAGGAAFTLAAYYVYRTLK